MKNVHMRFIALMLSVIMIFSLTACETGITEDDENWNSEAATLSDYDSSSIGRMTSIEVSDNGSLKLERATRDSEVSMGEAGTWSVFVYLCGTDLETYGGCATEDLEEMMDIGSDENLNIIVQTGGTRSWDTRGVSSKNLQRYKINDDGMELLCEGERASMGSAETLYSFLSWGVENYPAEHMAVIFWNHGSGSINGVCFDEQYHDDSLYLTEIEEAMARVYDEMTCRFEFVGFDACLMATIETANVLVPHAKYMIASEELESGYGWDYEAFLEYIADNPDCDGKDVGQVICRSYYSFCEYTGEEDEATMSVIDLEKVDDFLVAFNDVAKEMVDLSSDLSELSKITRSITKAENYGGNNQSEGYTNMVDLGDILSGLEGIVEGSDEALVLLKDMIAYKINGDNCPKSSGVAIYYPLSVQGSSELNILRNICVSPYYMNFVESIAYGSSNGGIDDYEGNDWSDNDYYYEDDFGFNDYFNEEDSEEYFDGWDDWFNLSENDGWYNTDSELINFEVEPYVNEDCCYTMIIAEESLDYVQAIYFALFKDDDSDDMVYLGNDNAVYYDYETGEVYDYFMGEWPMLPDGQCVAIYLVEEGEGYNIYSIPILLNGEEMSLRVKMEYDEDEVFGDFTVLGVWEGISESGQAGRSNIDVKSGDIIKPIYETSHYETGEEGLIYGKEYKVGSDFNISAGLLPDADYYYSYEIVDIFGTSIFTEETVFTVEDGELFGYPDENAEEYDSYFSEGFFDDFNSGLNDIWNNWNDSGEDYYDDSYWYDEEYDDSYWYDEEYNNAHEDGWW